MKKFNETVVDEKTVEHINNHRNQYYSWIRHVVALSSGSLTLLVALQNSYIPHNPRHLWLLQLCWLGFALSTLAGVIALRGEWKTTLKAAQKRVDCNANAHSANLAGDHKSAEDKIEQPDGTTVMMTQPSSVYLRAEICLSVFYVLAMLLLVVFAVLNLGEA